MTSQAADHRRATAERNVAAILDAAAELLSQQEPCAGEVRAGRLEAGDAQRVLIVTVTDLFAGGRR